MRDITRGFVAAALEDAVAGNRLQAVVADVEAFQQALTSSDLLRLALTDSSLPLAGRRGVVRDLLAAQAPEASAVIAFLIGSERSTDLPAVVSQTHLVLEEALGSVLVTAAEPRGGRWSVWDRLKGYAEFVFSHVANIAEVDTIEDELFRFARVVEESPELAEVLTDRNVPIAARVGIVSDLLAGKASTTTSRLVGYLLRAGHVRDLVRALDHLVELAAAERGRRFAEVRAPAPLAEADRLRLAAALALMAGRPVEVRVVIDESVIGGMLVSIGDTLIDGTVRHRLDQLRESLGTSAWSAA